MVLSGERTFQQQRTSSCLFIVIALVGGGMCLAWLLGGLVLQHTLATLIGLVGLVLFLVIPAVIWYSQTSYTIVVRPDGFAVARQSRRRGESADEYRWEEVTGTRYYEHRTSQRGSRAGDVPTGYFAVETERGTALNVSERMRGFHELIEIVNAMTPHLPYVWTRQTGGSVSIGPISVGRGGYRQVPRDEAAATWRRRDPM